MNQIQQDLQNELSTTNQLLRLISMELQRIKHLTNSGGEFETNISQNAMLMRMLGNLQQVDLDKIPPFSRRETNNSKNLNQDASYEHHTTSRNGMDSEMDENE